MQVEAAYSVSRETIATPYNIEEFEWYKKGLRIN